ncbi:hypothetical protein PF008_g23878 [Phytophthora fragariae]|uniref:Integrase catalytic domain-containing protein n=1 Tax=Phytophthora fragariae TaxID=53985 RepID=A0A6G0QPI4_9STRA|nr:hypothetical protein PF008_g23878 [Phytophthora fragariae]
MSFDSWSSFLPMAEFALNNSTHASTGLTPFFVNNARRPRVPALLAVRSSNAAAVSTLGGGGVAPTSKSAQDSSEPPPAKSNTRDATVEGHTLHGMAYEDVFAVDVASPTTSAVANFAPAATRRRSTLQQCPSSSCTFKPSRGLCVTRSKSLWIDRKLVPLILQFATCLPFLDLLPARTLIDGAGRTCRPSGETSEYFYLRMASKALP